MDPFGFTLNPFNAVPAGFDVIVYPIGSGTDPFGDTAKVITVVAHAIPFIMKRIGIGMEGIGFETDPIGSVVKPIGFIPAPIGSGTKVIGGMIEPIATLSGVIAYLKACPFVKINLYPIIAIQLANISFVTFLFAIAHESAFGLVPIDEKSHQKNL